MKKIVIYVTILLLLLTKVASSQVASISTVNGAYGNMQVAVNLNGFTAANSLGAITMKIGFDPNVVSFTGISHNLIAYGIQANANGNVITIAWSNTPAVSVNGIGFMLNFNYTGGSCNLSFNQGCEIADGDANIIQTTFLSGAINQPAVNTVATINTQDGDYNGVNEVPISFVTSPIPLPNYNVGAINLNISYNDTKLQFLGIDGLLGATANASNGVISIVWANATPVDLNTLNLKLRFNYLGGVSALNFTGTNSINSPLGIQIPTSFNNGAVNQPPTFANVDIGTTVGNPGGTTTVPVVFSAFPVSQGSATMNIAYNSSVLNFVGTSGLSGLNANASNGIITLTWVNNAGSMISGFDLLFNYLGGSGNIEFTGTNGITNTSGNTIPVTFTNGNVTQSITPINATLGNTALTLGSSNVLLPLNFSGVSGNVYSTIMYVNFDNSKLTYMGVENATAGVIVNQDLSTQTIIITWSNTNASIANGKFLDLKFNNNGGAGNCDVPVYFTSFNANMSSFSDALGNTVIANLVNGNVNTIPSVYNITGGGHYCFGGTGVLIGLNGSQTGVNYQLKLEGINVTGASFIGNGSPFNFDLQTIAGNYTVLATNGPGSTCTNMMNGNANIVIDPLPVAAAGGNTTINTIQTATVTGATATNGTIAWTHNGLGTLTAETTLTPTYTPVTGDAGNTVILTMTVTSPNCGTATATYTVNVIPVTYVISGTLKYNNTAGSALSGTKVYLTTVALVPIDSTITNISGNYQFNAPNGSYKLDAGCNKPFGGLNSSDVSRISMKVSGIPLPSENVLRLQAADLNLNGFFQSNDVSIASARNAGTKLPSYKAPNWLFGDITLSGTLVANSYKTFLPTIIVNGANVTQNLWGICSGDVNGSYNTIP